MPGEHHRFTAKEHRQVEHIAKSEEHRGMSHDEAESIGYATVNKNVGATDPTRRFSKKEHRQIDHIEASEEQRGKSPSEAKSIAYATVSKKKANPK